MLIWRPRRRSIALVVANQSFNDAGEMLWRRGRQISMTVRKYKLILPAYLSIVELADGSGDFHANRHHRRKLLKKLVFRIMR